MCDFKGGIDDFSPLAGYLADSTVLRRDMVPDLDGGRLQIRLRRIWWERPRSRRILRILPCLAFPYMWTRLEIAGVRDVTWRWVGGEEGDPSEEMCLTAIMRVNAEAVEFVFDGQLVGLVVVGNLNWTLSDMGEDSRDGGTVDVLCREVIGLDAIETLRCGRRCTHEK